MEVRPKYKTTEMGDIPKGWEVKSLGELASVSAGGTPDRSNSQYWNGDIPWVTTSEVDFYTITNAGQFITREGLEHSAAKLLPPGTLLMALYGQGKTRGKTGLLGIEAATNQACAAISLGRSVSPEFIFHFLASQYEAIRKLSNTGNQENLNGSLVRSIPILLPPSPEQRAIAAVLSDVDALLGALDRLITKKRDLKQAAMQQLLTGQTRLPGFHGEWGVKCFGELASIRNQKVMPTNVPADTLCVELEHIGQGDGRLVAQSTAQQSASSKYRFLKGDVLFGRLRSYLRKYWLSDRPGICTTEIWPLVVDPNHADAKFLLAVVQSDGFIEAASMSYGTHMPRADWGVVRNFAVHCPSVDEQVAIATVLSAMDSELVALEVRRDKIRALKLGMMQELLTGRTRLVSPETANA